METLVNLLLQRSLDAKVEVDHFFLIYNLMHMMRCTGADAVSWHARPLRG